MWHGHSRGRELAILLSDASLRHRRAVVISEEPGQPLGRREPEVTVALEPLPLANRGRGSDFVPMIPSRADARALQWRRRNPARPRCTCWQTTPDNRYRWPRSRSGRHRSSTSHPRTSTVRVCERRRRMNRNFDQNTVRVERDCGLASDVGRKRRDWKRESDTGRPDGYRPVVGRRGCPEADA